MTKFLVNFNDYYLMIHDFIFQLFFFYKEEKSAPVDCSALDGGVRTTSYVAWSAGQLTVTLFYKADDSSRSIPGTSPTPSPPSAKQMVPNPLASSRVEILMCDTVCREPPPEPGAPHHPRRANELGAGQRLRACCAARGTRRSNSGRGPFTPAPTPL